MTNNILGSIKTLLGINVDCTEFDNELLIHINSVFSTLIQIGATIEVSDEVVTKESLWEDFISTQEKINLCKVFVYLKVRLVFDPPQTSFVIEAININLKELEWRIQNG